MALTFATFNIRNGWGRDGLHSWPFRRSSTLSTISALGADVVGLQEVFEFQRRYLSRRMPELRWFGQGRSGGYRGEQCPIAVHGDRLTVTRHETRWFGWTPHLPGTRLPGASFPRITTLARCWDQRTGAVFDVANTHLDEHVVANRVAGIEQLAGWLDQSVPTVVLGDLNADAADSAVFAPLLDAGFQHIEVSGGTSHNFTGAADGRQIDHIFASPHWIPEQAAVVRERHGRRLPSDHWPVRATLSLR
ncbi:endonuclease/exonuclease/phosphatase family protein [Phytoactinopolyspora halotolerans]|uniref:Endonuclease/exonuclease/phosphatase family protein n=1 Tax=Phytoactinopolyspora halotolerans TaxID=1981512 RepID=A0A6L9S5G4_9ACTN|nr:endonuclease/exonuclease/phosphatase family protein [Phytoactinopolyspora halotolerans]NEE00287.1 endonuclease/exonuclease/phosphatase family protein [Phytoactinopolyspora halotolerans]